MLLYCNNQVVALLYGLHVAFLKHKEFLSEQTELTFSIECHLRLDRNSNISSNVAYTTLHVPTHIFLNKQRDKILRVSFSFTDGDGTELNKKQEGKGYEREQNHSFIGLFLLVFGLKMKHDNKLGNFSLFFIFKRFFVCSQLKLMAVDTEWEKIIGKRVKIMFDHI